MNKCSYEHQCVSHQALEDAAELLKTMGDPTRLGILHRLLHEELQVGELARLLGHTQSAISHQLRLLRNMRLVKTRREGRNIFYSLDDEHVVEIIRITLTHADEA